MLLCLLIEVFRAHCSQIFLIYLLLGFAGVSYGRLIALRFGFNLSTYVQKRWWKVGGERFKRRNGWKQLTDASSAVRTQSRTGVVRGSKESLLCQFPVK